MARRLSRGVKDSHPFMMDEGDRDIRGSDDRFTVGGGGGGGVLKMSQISAISKTGTVPDEAASLRATSEFEYPTKRLRMSNIQLEEEEDEVPYS